MRNEKRESRLDGSSLVKNSGRGENKGDATITIGDVDFLVDYKHYRRSFSLTKKAWDKLTKDAWNSSHREALIKVIWEDGSEVCIVDWNLFKQKMEENK